MKNKKKKVEEKKRKRKVERPKGRIVQVQK